MGSRSVSLLAMAIVACGGLTAGEKADGGPQGSGASDGSAGTGADASLAADAPPGVDAPVVVVDAVAQVKCMQVGTGGTSGGSSCQAGITESCDDGRTYYVNCSCPEATCLCEYGYVGQTWYTVPDAGIPFSGCPSEGCPPSSAEFFAICGFPGPG
jgi:hypothetical protein